MEVSQLVPGRFLNNKVLADVLRMTSGFLQLLP